MKAAKTRFTIIWTHHVEGIEDFEDYCEEPHFEADVTATDSFRAIEQFEETFPGDIVIDCYEAA